MHGLMVRVQPMQHKVMGSNPFGAIPCYIMILPPRLNDKCYESSLIEDLVYLGNDDGSLQEELEHSPNL